MINEAILQTQGHIQKFTKFLYTSSSHLEHINKNCIYNRLHLSKSMLDF